MRLSVQRLGPGGGLSEGGQPIWVEIVDVSHCGGFYCNWDKW